MNESPYRLERLVPHLDTFASLSGVDMRRPLSAELRAFLVRAISERILIVVEGQDLDEAAHEQLATSLGRRAPQAHSWAAGAMSASLRQSGDAIYFTHGDGFANDPGSDPASLWGEVDANHSPRGFSCWHTDDTEKVDVARVSILHGIDAPGRGGATLFADTQTAFDALDPSLKSRVEGLRAIHFFAFPGAPLPVSQPLVRTNPVTGRRCLYLNFNSMDRIEGLEKAESNALLEALFRHVTRPEFVYRHAWSKGDCLVWNNVGSMHRREALVSGERRVLRRFQVEIPELAAGLKHEPTRRLTEALAPWSAYPFDLPLGQRTDR